jgi:hypothetical protein
VGAGRGAHYEAWLAGVMLALTAAALAVIRASYHGLHGPDTDPYGAYKHFANDLAGMAAHLAAAGAVVCAPNRVWPVSR